MKVLMFSWEYPPYMVGGLGQHVYDLSRFLANQGLSIHIITPCFKGAPDYEFLNGVHIHRVGKANSENINFKSWIFTFNSEAIREAVRINMKIGGFTLVHAHDWLVAYAGRAVAKIFEIPLVTTIHATEYGRNRGLHNRIQIEINEIEKNLALEADHIICCSQYMYEEICSLFGVPGEAVSVIPNGVEAEQFKDLSAQPDIFVNDDEKLVFFLGRLVPEKGAWELLSCFPRVLEKIPDAKLLIGGNGPQKDILEKRAKELNISDKVMFAGFIKEKKRNYFYNRANVAAFPSLYEPFGIVALEAMATNTPVIVGNVGGLAEIVIDGITGVKVPPGDVEKLADAIITVLSNQKFAADLCENALQKIRTVYSWKYIAKSTTDLYKNILEINKNRREVS